LPSTPAVLRPALTSVTRRTLTRALLRERSISFCRLRTLARSPACVAAKIRRLKRRTWSSAWPQSAKSQSRSSSSGPFTRSVSNLSLGSGVLTSSPRRLTRPASALFRAGQQPYPASYAGTAGGGASIWSRFPAAFRPPAFASRVFLRPLGIPLPLRSAYRQISRRTPSGLSRSACDRYDRGGRPLNPGDGGALPASQIRLAGTRRLATAGPYSPASRNPPARVLMTRRHRGFTHVHPSGLPQPVTPGWNRSPSAFPRASHPTVTHDARRGGDGPLRTGPGATPSTSIDPPSTSSTHHMRPRVALSGSARTRAQACGS